MNFRFAGRSRFVAVVGALALAAGVGTAVASSSSSTSMGSAHTRPSNMGPTSYGMTKAFYDGHAVSFTYSKGFWCDPSVSSKVANHCEAGANFKKAPAKEHEPLYITVPLGFSTPAMSMDCPTGITCVDHPGHIDLSRLEPALKPLYPKLTKAQLTKALSNASTPGHDHFIDTRAGGKAIWWDVKVVGVTNKAEYDAIARHKSSAYLLRQVKAGKTTAVIPTNLFLFFAV